MGDPCENIVAAALDRRGLRYEREVPIGRKNGKTRSAIDFFLPDLNLYIECKQMHSERSIRQMEGLGDAILIQGIGAARAFAKFLHDAA